MPSQSNMAIDNIERACPSSLAQIRKVLASASSEALKLLGEIENSFYGTDNSRVQVAANARMVSKMMHQVNLSWLTEPIHMDRLVSRAIYEEENDLTAGVGIIRELYDKTWKYVPGCLQPVISKIEQILRIQTMYCPPVYDPANDPYIQIASDYFVKHKAWTADIKKYVTHVSEIQQRFFKGRLFLDEMSQSTREMAMKLEAEECPFVFAFYDACEVLKEAIRCLREWLTVANEYTSFLSSEVEELSKTKTALHLKALKQQDKFNKDNYKLIVMKQSLESQLIEQANIQSKEMEMLVREEMLMGKKNEMRLDFDIKEFQLAEMHRTVNVKTSPAEVVEAMNRLSEEVRVEGQELDEINKELSLIKLKMSQVIEKQESYKKLSETCSNQETVVSNIKNKYHTTKKELTKVSLTIDHIKYMIQYLNTPDTAQKIFLELPRRREALGLSRAHGLNIPCAGDDMMDQVFDVLSNHLGSRWVQVYRDLPFYPMRGQNTIENDIRQIQMECVRESLDKEVRKSLERWRRFNTRARPSELLDVIQKLGDKEILNSIDKIVNPPRPKTPIVETFPTFLEQNLIPYYQAVSRYDRLKSNKKEAIAKP